MAWDTHVQGLNTAVVSHLGEEITISDNDALEVSAVGVLTDPQFTSQVAGADFVMSEPALVIREVDAPAWLARGHTVTREADGVTFQVVRHEDNGEGLLEVTLCR